MSSNDNYENQTPPLELSLISLLWSPARAVSSFISLDPGNSSYIFVCEPSL